MAFCFLVFHQLNATHRDFHAVAEEIVLLIAADKPTDAQVLFEGAFSDLSDQIIGQLQLMRKVSMKSSET